MSIKADSTSEIGHINKVTNVGCKLQVHFKFPISQKTRIVGITETLFPLPVISEWVSLSKLGSIQRDIGEL